MYIKSITAILALSLPTSVWASPITDAYTSFYTFGDSLSDDGKFLALDPPSLGGRFSKDLVWAERIEDQFIAAGRDTANLAIGGATAGDQTTPATPLSTFGGQIGPFKPRLASGRNRRATTRWCQSRSGRMTCSPVSCPMISKPPQMQWQTVSGRLQQSPAMPLMIFWS
ncbi:hypothetical protein [Sulfitobacter sp. JL08]|uniref:hypothetical protein n=1 Tax=Sulfitobacter sp. JL08 TaxID=2070369 RepID=UPI0034A0B9F9